MPNWCSNVITITGPNKKLEKLWNEAQDNGLLHAMKPMPEQLNDTVKGFGDASKDDEQTETFEGYSNWYDWALNYWGTKWDVDTDGLEFEDHGDGTASINGWFESAWCQPTEAFENYCAENTDVEIHNAWYEPGMDAGGVWNGIDNEEFIEDLTEAYENGTGGELYQQLDEIFGITQEKDDYDEDWDDEDEQAL